MPQIRPIADLRSKTEISDICHTKSDSGDLVVMRVETYEAMLDQNELDSQIAQAEMEFQNDHQLINAREALSTLQRKHFG